MTRVSGSWAQVLSLFGTPTRPRRGPDGERLWVGASDWDHVDVRLPRRTSFLLICPKSQPIDWWSAENSLPRDVAVACGPYPTEQRALPIFEALCRQASAAVFVGDMDPYAIVQYGETRRMLAGAGVSLLYGGVDDAWLGAMERSLGQRGRLERLRIPLEKHEIRLLKQVDRAIDLETLVGPRGCSVLRSGYKIELEGATNPALYHRRHGHWVFRYLRSRIADQARDG
jgi:hypothetical protein